MHVTTRNQVRRIDPTRTDAAHELPEIAWPAPHPAAWSIVEDEPDAAPPPTPGSGIDRRVSLVLALAGAIVGFGFAGGSPTPPSADAGSDRTGITLIAPVADAEVGGVLEVRGVADRPIGRLTLAVEAAGVIIGATDLDIAAAGPFKAEVLVLAPPAEVRAELVARLADDPEGPAFRRGLVLRPAGPVTLWSAEVRRSDDGTSIELAGSAPLAMRAIAIEVWSPDGRSALVEARVAIVPDPGLPGSSGGWSLGVGSFRASVRVPGPLAGGPLRVTVSWRDDAASGWGSLWVGLPGPAFPRRP